jgi:peroxiredoxin Q/BCP
MSKYILVFALLVATSIVAKPISSITEVPAAGTAAPTFKLVTNEGKDASLSDFAGKWVVLYFYPKDFTSGCTLEAHNFQRDLEKYSKANAVILGVSVDTADSHKEFCAKEGLNFKLLADTGGKVSESYGSIMDYNGAKYSARNTFIIDPKGKIAKVFEKVKVGTHSDEVLAALAELQKS